MLGRLTLVSIAVAAAAACTSSPTSARSDGCPANMPNNGDACILANPSSPPGAIGVCGYTTDTNECGAVNCYCMNNAWGCNPTCAIIDASASDQSTNDATWGDVPDADIGAPVEAGHPCNSNADCDIAHDLLCGYATDGGCSASGVCINAFIGGCACDAGGALVCNCAGDLVPPSCCYPQGYQPFPLAPSNACGGDGGAEGAAEASADGAVDTGAE